MLKVPCDKSIYRHCYQVDLKADTSTLHGDYGAMVWAGTSTFGHLGAETFIPLLVICAVDALFCIGVNVQHSEKEGFSLMFRQLHAQGKISQQIYTQQKIHTSKKGEHANDVASVVVYRKQ